MAASRKLYRELADNFNIARWPGDGDPVVDSGMIAMWEVLVEQVAISLSDDNPRFSTDKFYEACGYYESRKQSREGKGIYR